MRIKGRVIGIESSKISLYFPKRFVEKLLLVVTSYYKDNEESIHQTIVKSDLDV